MEHGYWGPEHKEDEVFEILDKRDDEQWDYQVERFGSPAETAKATAKAIADGLVVGWYQGRMEWGARALGNRSIVADPRRADMRELINTKIKFREKFRSFNCFLRTRMDAIVVGDTIIRRQRARRPAPAAGT